MAQIAINGDISQGFLYLNRDLATVKTLDSDGKELQRFEPCSLGLQFPLFAGKKWQGRSRRFDEGKDAGTFAGTYRVVKVESVAVAAGTFRSFRVEGETYDLKAPDTRWRFVRWYAPQARAEVKVQAMTPGANPVEFEVTEFSPAQSPPPK
ncbi:MAG TPA: hypothetical protein VLS90_13750 [Thermodesulfobacteriota bacterium]|nr:hypothetical protein [Thermodesulfobacteriota bacterium]